MQSLTAPPPHPFPYPPPRTRITSLTTQVFGPTRPGYYRIYYIIDSSQKLDHALSQPHPVVLMFWAKGNEPCKVMMKPFRDLAEAKRNNAVFCRLDVDERRFQGIVERYKVEALPTFLVMNGPNEKARVVGAKVEELNTIIKGSLGSVCPSPQQAIGPACFNH